MKKYMLSLVALVVAVATMAFTNVETTGEVAEEAMLVQYRFNGTMLSEVHTLNKWSQISGSSPSCSGSNLPCVVAVQGETLQEFLNARTAEEVVEDAISKKN